MTWARHGQHHVLPNCGREHASFSSELTPSLPSKVSRPRLLQSEKWGFFPKLENLDLWPVKCSTIWKRGNDMWWKRISIANRTFPKLYHTQITNCRRFSGGHIAQVAFLPLEIWGESPPSPRGVPIIRPRNRMCMLVQCYLQSKTQGLGRDPRIAARRDKISHPWPFTKPQLTGPAVMIALSNSENYPQLCKYFGKQH